MKMADFDEHAGRFMSQMADIMAAKNPDYSTEADDAMSNYYEIARIAGVSPQQAWLVLFSKHLTAIMTWAQGRDLKSETIEHRFIDAANYAVLGAALAKDLATRPRIAEVRVSLDVKDMEGVADALEVASNKLKQQEQVIKKLEIELQVAREQNQKVPLRKTGVSEIITPQNGDPLKREEYQRQQLAEQDRLLERTAEEALEDTTMTIEDVFSELLEIAADIPTTIAEKSDPKRIFLTDSMYEVVSKLEGMSRFSMVRTLHKFLCRSGITQSMKFQPFVEQIQKNGWQEAVSKFQMEHSK